MNLMHGEMIVHQSLSIRTHGQPITLPAVISNGTRLDGDAQYVSIESQSDAATACLGQRSRDCYQHGVTLSLWAKFRRLTPGMFYLSTGNGIKV